MRWGGVRLCGERDGAASDCGCAISCGSRGGPPWHVVYTHPQAELVALENLRSQGFTAYLPVIRERRPCRTAGRRPHVRDVPLFPRYLFVSFDPEADAWGAIWFTRGVRSLLRSAPYTPAQVPDGIVEALIERAGPDGVIDEGAHELPPIQPGQEAQVISGPLEGLSGVCSWSSKKRVRLLLQMIGGGQMPVELNREQVA